MMCDKVILKTLQTSGIHGGYRLVSTYDLPDCKTTRGGEYFGVDFEHPKSEGNGGGVGIPE